MYCPFCGLVHINYILCSPGSRVLFCVVFVVFRFFGGFFWGRMGMGGGFSLSEWSFTMCEMPYI